MGAKINRSSLANALGGAAISLTTILLVIVAFEIVLRYAYPPPYQWDMRLMFFSQGEVYRNKDWGGFVYAPNARIHARTYYITSPSGPELAKEYEYDIETNSYGLVQHSDIDRSKPAILFLGDSFTEGQGASPWFYGFEARWPTGSRYQIINGGIQGSGFEAWERLYKDISKTADIEKLVVIFISDDWTRSLWQLPQPWLDCLRLGLWCGGSDPFLGLPDDPNEAGLQIERLAKARLDFLALKKRARGIFKSSQIYQQLLEPAYELWRPAYKANFERNKDAALRLVTLLGSENVLFFHIPQKDELPSGPNTVGRQATKAIRENGLRFVDGFQKCQFKINDYLPHDGHMNAIGYGKLVKCIDDELVAFQELTPTKSSP